MNKLLPFTLTGKALEGGAVLLTSEQAQALGLDKVTTGEVRGEIKTYGPWQIALSYRALCVSTKYVSKEKQRYAAERESETFYGMRTLSKVRQEGYCLEGTVSVLGRKVRAFTSSQLFELPDERLISVATIHACL